MGAEAWLGLMPLLMFVHTAQLAVASAHQVLHPARPDIVPTCRQQIKM